MWVENGGFVIDMPHLMLVFVFATMVTKSRRRKKQKQTWKQERGDSIDQVGLIKEASHALVL